VKILPTPFLADRGDDRKRLDRVLRRRLGFTAGLSRTRLQELIEAGAVTVNGRVVTRPSARVLEGDRLQLAGVEPRPRPRPQPEPIPLQVLHEDEHLIVVEKPAGMVSHPAFRHASGTLLNALLDYARGWPPGTQPLLAGRLDKLTSGLVVAAKRPAAHAALVRSLGAPGAEKVYFALVQARVPRARGTLRFSLRRDPFDRRRVVASTWEGQPSETRYHVLARGRGRRAGVTALACRLVTGRMHQIRAHLKAAGWPLVGDPVYGAPLGDRPVDQAAREAIQAFGRQALHAWRVRFRHPVTGALVDVEAPIPGDLRALVTSLGLSVS